MLHRPTLRILLPTLLLLAPGIHAGTPRGDLQQIFFAARASLEPSVDNAPILITARLALDCSAIVAEERRALRIESFAIASDAPGQNGAAQIQVLLFRTEGYVRQFSPTLDDDFPVSFELLSESGMGVSGASDFADVLIAYDESGDVDVPLDFLATGSAPRDCEVELEVSEEP